MKRILFQRVKVQDHAADDPEWVDPDTYTPQKTYLEYVGWLIQENDNMLTLAQGRCWEGKNYTYDNLINLMKANVVKRKTLKIT